MPNVLPGRWPKSEPEPEKPITCPVCGQPATELITLRPRSDEPACVPCVLKEWRAEQRTAE